MSEERCDCGHLRRQHAIGIWECRWCRCKEYRPPVVPDIFEDLPDAEPEPPVTAKEPP